jgi:hypothetical protein
MNVFFLDRDPKLAAEFHNDWHVARMIYESAVLLSLANERHGKPGPYFSKRHLNHPCTKWVAESKSNWLWVKQLAKELNSECIWRYDSEPHLSWMLIESLECYFDVDLGLTKPALAMPDRYKNPDPVVAYRQYYVGGKKHLAVWTTRQKPDWWDEYAKKMALPILEQSNLKVAKDILRSLKNGNS